jgi:menaquinone-dependent protoporphyrinogen oxidase
MRNTLVIYSSVDGHTQKISSKIAEHIKHHANVDLTSLVDAQSLSLKNYQQVIIGASIRYGNYRKELFEFIEKNLDELSSKENAFFSVNVVARKPEKILPILIRMLQNFSKQQNGNQTKWMFLLALLITQHIIFSIDL